MPPPTESWPGRPSAAPSCLAGTPAVDGHGPVRPVDGKRGNKGDGQGSGQGKGKPRRDEAGQDSHQGRPQDEGEFVRGALVGQGRVEVLCRSLVSRPLLRGLWDVSAIHRTRASGPTCGQLAPETNAAARQGRGEGPGRGHGVGCGDQYEHSNGVEGGCDQQDRALAPPVGQGPEHGAPMAEPIPTAPAAVPPTAYEPLTEVTRVRVPTVSMAKGRRAKSPSGTKLRAGQLRKPGKAAFCGRPGSVRSSDFRPGAVLQGGGCGEG